MIDLDETAIPNFAYRPYKLASDYADYHQVIFYKLHFQSELSHFFTQKSGNLFVVALVYLFLTGVLIISTLAGIANTMPNSRLEIR